MQTSNDANLLRACQHGSLSACEQIVRRYQEELLRTAFLLTGDARLAVSLASETFLDLFRESLRSEPDREIRPWLLRIAVRHYLAGRVAVDKSINITPKVDAGPRHFHVDDERARLRAALDRLDRPVRAGIILREFNRLGEEETDGILGTTPAASRAQLYPAQRRLRESVGASDDQPVYGLLTAAALDGPRVGLWPELEPRVERLFEREQQRKRAITAGIVAFAGLVLLGGLLWLFSDSIWSGGDAETSGAAASAGTLPPTEPPPPTGTPDPAPTAEPLTLPDANLPDTQLLTAYRRDNGQIQQSTLSYDPETNTASEIGDFDPPTLISPDGRWIGSEKFWEDEQSTLHHLLTIVRTETMTPVWKLEIAPARRWGRWPVALTSKRVYMLQPPADKTGSFAIRALDIATGEEAGSWPVTLESVDLGVSIDAPTVHLFVSPDESQLYLAAERRDQVDRTWTRSVATYSLPDMERVDSHWHQTKSAGGEFQPDFDFGGAIPTPDGRFLYAVQGNNQGERPAVRFYEFASGDVTTVEMPFDPALSSSFPAGLSVPSNSGKTLYVIAWDQRQVAVIDLLDRTIERVFPIDPGDYAGELEDENFNSQARYHSAYTLSPDGRWLYMSTVRPTGNGSGGEQYRSLIWVIDTATWAIVDQWQVAGLYPGLEPSKDGRRVIIHTRTADTQVLTMRSPDGQQDDIVRSLDQLPLPEWAEGFQMTSPATIYLKQYGRRPSVGGVAPDDPVIESTLPRVEITAGDDPIAAGSAASVALRFLDPASGQPLTGAQPGVRYSPDASITIRLIHREGAATDVIIVPGEADQEGYSRGSAQLREIGWWNARVLVTNPDGSSWQARLPNAVQVTRSFAGTDGERYIPRLSSDQGSGVTEDVPIQLAFVNAETGDPIPDGVTLDVGMPERISATFAVSEADSGSSGTIGNGYTSATLTRASHAAYEGRASFWTAGSWTVEITFRPPNGNRISVGAGKLELQPAE